MISQSLRLIVLILISEEQPPSGASLKSRRTRSPRALVNRGAMPLALSLSLSCFATSPAPAEPLASDWVEGHNVRTRLIAGATGMVGSTPKRNEQIVAGLEMELADGWKTYWRFPGDAGGVPPEFDWSQSANVAEANVLYPAPRRMTDRAGSTIGYKKHVVFPVHVRPRNPAEPVTLKLQLTFGVCHDICVPSEGNYEVTLPAGDKPPLPEALADAVKRVPAGDPAAGQLGAATADMANAPRLEKVETSLTADPPTVTLHVTFPAGTAGADVFVEGPPAEFVPLPVQKGKAGEKTLIFSIDLSKGADVAALTGKPLVATLVSDNGASTSQFILE